MCGNVDAYTTFYFIIIITFYILTFLILHRKQFERCFVRSHLDGHERKFTIEMCDCLSVD